MDKQTKKERKTIITELKQRISDLERNLAYSERQKNMVEGKCEELRAQVEERKHQFGIEREFETAKQNNLMQIVRWLINPELTKEVKHERMDGFRL